MLELRLDKPFDLKLRDTASLPAPKDGEIKIKVAYGGICGSDIRIYKGDVSYAPFPMRMGHEIIGVVVEAGAGAGLPIGARVAIEPNAVCGTCEWCRQGRVNICSTRVAWGINDPNGGFGEEFVCAARYAVVIPDDVPDERAILTEPLAVAVHMAKRARIAPGDSVAIIGCGCTGLLTLALVDHLGAKATVFDSSAKKLALAKSIVPGVDTVQPADFKPNSFEIVMESAGAKPAIDMAFEIVKPGGRIVEIGLIYEEVAYPVIRIVRNEISVLGSISYTMEDFKEALNYLRDPAFNVAPVLGRIYPVASFQEAMEAALSGDYAKIAIKF